MPPAVDRFAWSFRLKEETCAFGGLGGDFDSCFYAGEFDQIGGGEKGLEIMEAVVWKGRVGLCDI